MNLDFVMNATHLLAAGASTSDRADSSPIMQMQGKGLTSTQVIVCCIIAAIVGVVFWYVARTIAMREGRSYFSAKGLFRELCRTHELDWPRRRLLRQLAYAHKLENPAQLFLEPGWFEPSEIPEVLQPHRAELVEIKQHLFRTP